MKRFFPFVVWLLSGIVLLLPVLTPFLHNHEADLAEHPDCPAHNIALAFHHITLHFLLILFFLVPLLYGLSEYDCPLFPQPQHSCHSQRAPPPHL
jgi:hypothetical protein